MLTIKDRKCWISSIIPFVYCYCFLANFIKGVAFQLCHVTYVAGEVSFPAYQVMVHHQWKSTPVSLSTGPLLASFGP